MGFLNLMYDYDEARIQD